MRALNRLLRWEHEAQHPPAPGTPTPPATDWFEEDYVRLGVLVPGVRRRSAQIAPRADLL